MKKILLFLFFTFLCKAQTPQAYTSFQSTPLNLYAWNGSKVMILSSSNSLNQAAMTKWINAMDGTYNYYQLCNGREPNFNSSTYINNRSTIAEVASTCGAGCGYLGTTGIELQTTYFNNTYNGILNNNEYDQAVFYEFGRNFWFYDNQLKYKTSDPVVTGYAIFMRFMAIENLGLNGGPFGSLSFTNFKNQIKNLLPAYMADTSLNWNNTLGQGKGVPNLYGASDLFASFCFYLKENYGGQTWVQNVWKQVALRPTALTTQDAVDNFIIASSKAANSNLTALFQNWRWPISQNAINELSCSSIVTPTFSESQPICLGQQFPVGVLNTTSNNGISGTWSPDLDNTKTVEYTFTPTPGSCAYTTKKTLVVNVCNGPIDITKFNLYGSSTNNGGGCINLTNASNNYETGMAWHQSSISLRHDFDFTFSVTQNGTAEGMAFVMQQNGNTVYTADAGADMGYYGIGTTHNLFAKSLAIEFDIYNNNSNYNDSNNSHITLVKNKIATALKGPYSITPYLGNGASNTIRIVWSATSKTLTLYRNGSVLFSHNEDIENTIFSGNPTIYFGFTGATGGLNATQSFCVQSLDTTLGIKQQLLNQFSIYPNPTRSVLNLKVPKDIAITKIIITDLTGKVIKNQFVSENKISEANTIQINVDYLTRGMYIVEMFSGEEKFISKFIKD